MRACAGSHRVRSAGRSKSSARHRVLNSYLSMSHRRTLARRGAGAARPAQGADRRRLARRSAGAAGGPCGRARLRSATGSSSASRGCATTGGPRSRSPEGWPRMDASRCSCTSWRTRWWAVRPGSRSSSRSSSSRRSFSAPDAMKHGSGTGLDVIDDDAQSSRSALCSCPAAAGSERVRSPRRVPTGSVGVAARATASASRRQRWCSTSIRSAAHARPHCAYARDATRPAKWRFRGSSPSEHLVGTALGRPHS